MNATKRKAPSATSETLDKPSEETRKKSVRHRTALACEECRSRKRRCDGATPVCGGCVKRMSVCVYASAVQTNLWRESMMESLRSQLKELEKDNDMGIEPHGRASDHGAPIPDTGAGIRVDGDTAGAADTCRRPEAASPGVTYSAPQDQLSFGLDETQDGGDTGNHIETWMPREDHPAKGLEPCSIERLMKPIGQAIDSRSGRNDGPGKSLRPANAENRGFNGASQKACSCDRLLGASQWRLPLRRRADDLVALYFARVHRMYPIIHERTFRTQYQALWLSTLSPITGPPVSCSGLCKQKSKGKYFAATLHAILALASLFESSTLEQNIHQGDSYFELVQDIDLLNILDHEAGIELVQLGLLMGFYLQSTERFTKCWNITGLTIRMAQNMGLQLGLGEARRKGLFVSHATQLDCEMRVRVWHGCVLLDREISMSFGRPLMIFAGGEAVRLPEPIDDNRLSEEVGSWNVQPSGLPSLLESYIQTIKLYDILKQVLNREELQDSWSINSDIASLINLDTSIMEWRDALPSYLRYDPVSEETSARSRDIQTTSLPQFGVSSQAKRLYTRFLHVRTLILRPALVALFQKQQQPHLLGDRPSIEVRAQDLVLSVLGTQCVLLAHSLVKLLGAGIRNKSLMAWWYNISYLHTSGSTLLMAQLCTFRDMKIPHDLSNTWELCLQCISQYTNFSSIARKSVRLLKESAKFLLSQESVLQRPISDNLPSMNPIRGTLNESSPSHPEPSFQATMSHGTCQGSPGLAPSHHAGENATDSEIQYTQARIHAEQQLPVGCGGPSIDVPHLDVPEANLWNNDVGFGSYWPFMPFLSQLETFPSEFNSSGL